MHAEKKLELYMYATIYGTNKRPMKRLSVTIVRGQFFKNFTRIFFNNVKQKKHPKI